MITTPATTMRNHFIVSGSLALLLLICYAGSTLYLQAEIRAYETELEQGINKSEEAELRGIYAASREAGSSLDSYFAREGSDVAVFEALERFAQSKVSHFSIVNAVALTEEGGKGLRVTISAKGGEQILRSYLSEFTTMPLAYKIEKVILGNSPESEVTGEKSLEMTLIIPQKP